jgi:PHD/YefM family antitoxin component YafN of YafNO toxin-antitoxin module
MEVNMPIQYITDARGEKVAVVMPLAEWETLQEQLDRLTPAEAAAAGDAWQD